MPRYGDLDKLEKELSERLRDLRGEYGDYDAYTDGFDEAVERVEQAPTADVAPVVHARWIDDKYCSNCSHFEEDDEGYPVFSFSDYCPCCGAKMDGKEKQ